MTDREEFRALLYDHGDLQAESAGGFARKCRSCALRRQGRRRRPEGYRAADRRAGHYIKKRRAAQSGRDESD